MRQNYGPFIFHARTPNPKLQKYHVTNMNLMAQLNSVPEVRAHIVRVFILVFAVLRAPPRVRALDPAVGVELAGLVPLPSGRGGVAVDRVARVLR